MSSSPSAPSPDAPKQKAIHIGAPACFVLEEALRPISEAFGVTCCYVVGSALERPDWRDVDVRLILDDESFTREFPNANKHAWEHDARWLLFTIAISERLSKLTGLPIDFQIQWQSRANEQHKGPRNAVGFRVLSAQGDIQ